MSTSNAEVHQAQSRKGVRLRCSSDRFRLGVTVLFVIVVALACGSEEEKAPATSPTPIATPTPIETDMGQARSTAPGSATAPKRQKVTQKPVDLQSAGQQLRKTVDLPDYYPSDGPVYPGSEPSLAKLEGSKANVMFGTPDPVGTAANRMRSDLEDRGWTVGPEVPADGAVLLTGAKGSRQVSAFISLIEKGSADEITMVAVSVDR